MVEPEVLEQPQVQPEVGKMSPVFNTQEELLAWKEQNITKAVPEIQQTQAETPIPPKNEEVVKVEEVINKQPEFDEATYLKGIFGEQYDSPDKLKEALSKAYEVPEDLKPFLEEAKFFKEKPQLLEWIKLADKGADVPLAWQATQLDVAQLTPKDALVLDLVLNQGLSKEEATAHVELTHKAAFGSDDDYDANEKLAANGALKMQAKNAKERLVNFQQQMRIPEPERKAAEQKLQAEQSEAQRKSAWKPEVKKIADSFSIDYKGEFGKDEMKTPVDFKFNPDQKDREAYSKIVESIVENPNFQNTEQNREYVRQLADAIFLQQNREKIMNLAIQKALDERDAAWNKKVYNIPRTEVHQADNFSTTKIEVRDTRTENSNSKYGKW